MIENVQIRATKVVGGLGNLEYSGKLQKLNLPTLVHRREQGAMIELYKDFNVYAKDTLADSFQPRERSTRAHNYQLLERIPRDGVQGIQSNCFFSSTATLRNGTTSPLT